MQVRGMEQETKARCETQTKGCQIRREEEEKNVVRERDMDGSVGRGRGEEGRENNREIGDSEMRGKCLWHTGQKQALQPIKATNLPLQ